MVTGNVWAPTPSGGKGKGSGIGAAIGGFVAHSMLGGMSRRGREQFDEGEIRKAQAVSQIRQEEATTATDLHIKLMGAAAGHQGAFTEASVGGNTFKYREPAATPTPATTSGESSEKVDAKQSNDHKYVHGNSEGGAGAHTHLHKIDSTFYKVKGTVQNPETKKLMGAKKAYVQTHYPEGSPLRDRVENPPAKAPAKKAAKKAAPAKKAAKKAK